MAHKTIQEIRLANFFLLLRECEEECTRAGKSRGGKALLSRKTGVAKPYVSQLCNGTPNPDGTPRKIQDVAARKLEVGMHKSQGWMDQDHSAANSMDEAHWLDLYRVLTPTQREILTLNGDAFAAANSSRGESPPPEPDTPPARPTRRPGPSRH